MIFRRSTALFWQALPKPHISNCLFLPTFPLSLVVAHPRLEFTCTVITAQVHSPLCMSLGGSEEGMLASLREMYIPVLLHRNYKAWKITLCNYPFLRVKEGGIYFTSLASWELSEIHWVPCIMLLSPFSKILVLISWNFWNFDEKLDVQ